MKNNSDSPIEYSLYQTIRGMFNRLDEAGKARFQGRLLMVVDWATEGEPCIDIDYLDDALKLSNDLNTYIQERGL